MLLNECNQRSESALRASSGQTTVDSQRPVGRSPFSQVDTTSHLQPYGHGERNRSLHRPLHPNDGSATRAVTRRFRSSKGCKICDFHHAKAMARTLRASLAAKGFKITVSQSLELVAKAFGMAEWNTLSATIRAEAVGPRDNAPCLNFCST
jgi:hypothetical protein